MSDDSRSSPLTVREDRNWLASDVVSRGPWTGPGFDLVGNFRGWKKYELDLDEFASE